MAPNIVLMACGSFSPPTPMHFRMFEIARDYFQQMGSHKVIGGIMSPVHDAYKKSGLVSSSHRCNMIRLGLQTSDWIRLSDWETRQDEWTRTRMSLQYHQNYINSYINDDLQENEDTTDLQLPQWLPHMQNHRLQSSGPVQLRLLCGADILESFSVPNLWDPEDLETILSQHGIVVITRSGSNPEQFIFNSDLLSKYRRNITLITNWVANEVSSTMARRLISRGDSVKYLLDDRIVDYIRNKGLFACSTAHKSDNNKYNSVPLQDGIVLKLNRLHSTHQAAVQMMAVTPSPEDMLDAPDQHHISASTDEGQANVFCCDPLPSSKRHPDGRKSTRRRRGPGQAVQVLFEGPSQEPSEVRHNNHQHTGPKEREEAAVGKPFASGSHSLSIISSAPQLNSTPLLLPLSSSSGGGGGAGTTPSKAKASRASTKLTRHSSLRQPSERICVPGTLMEPVGGRDEGDARNYDDMIKFILTEHGIKVISEKEFVV